MPSLRQVWRILSPNSAMLGIATSTHAAGPAATLCTPTVVPRLATIASTFAELPAEQQRFAQEHDLTFRDVIVLLSAPSLNEHLDERRLMVLSMQLEASLQAQDWEMAEVILCMLIRGDLRRLFDAACKCGLGYTARQATAKLLPGSESTVRFGRLLLKKLENLVSSKFEAAERVCR